ncbi:hypothetical protein, partial [Sinorhizobium meliloti]|uniref:hypothetical protein n=1 Tax=Rhizobium meliloti TaxID=382 RepID=UPI001AECE210
DRAHRSHGEIEYFSRSSDRQKINDLAVVQGRLFRDLLHKNSRENVLFAEITKIFCGIGECCYLIPYALASQDSTSKNNLVSFEVSEVECPSCGTQSGCPFLSRKVFFLYGFFGDIC